jgi:hypothetical protein
MKVIKNPLKIPSLFIVDTIHENSDFSVLTAENGELHIDCYEISRINSVGVKKWIRFFVEQKAAGVRVFFYRLSTALVEQFNLITNFGGGGEVISIMLPLYCTSCGASQLAEKTKIEISKLNFKSLNLKCEKCGKATLRLDDEPADYLYFVRA